MCTTDGRAGNAFVYGAGSLSFKSRAGQNGHSVSNDSPPLRRFGRSCVALAQWSGDGAPQTCITLRRHTASIIKNLIWLINVQMGFFGWDYPKFCCDESMLLRVIGFFTFCLILFLYTILRIQIDMKKNRDSFWKIFLSPVGGMKDFFGARIRMTNNSKTTASRKTMFTSIDSETQVSYLCSIHCVALTALFFELFSKNCFYPFLLAISLSIKRVLSRPHRWPIGGRIWPKAAWSEKSNLISGWISS